MLTFILLAMAVAIAVACLPFIGYGSDFQLSTDGGNTYNTVGQCIDIDAPDIKCGDVDTSFVQMPAPWHTFQAKLADGGMAKFTLIYAKANFNTMLNNIRVNNNFKLIFPDMISTPSTLVFAGYISGIPTTLPLEELVKGQLTVKVSGKPTFTQGT